MANYYRGDTLPVVAKYKGYTFQPGDVVTVGVLQLDEDTEEYTVKASKSLTVEAQADEVQLELTRQDMHDIDGKVVIEVRTVTPENVEFSIQKDLTLRKDGLR